MKKPWFEDLMATYPDMGKQDEVLEKARTLFPEASVSVDKSTGQIVIYTNIYEEEGKTE